MKVEDLVKLNLDDFEVALKELGAQSEEFVLSLIEAEKAGKNRDGAFKIIEDAFATVETEIQTEGEPEPEIYTVKQGKSVSFRAGIKVHGDVVDLDWPEFKNEGFLESLIERELVVKK